MLPLCTHASVCAQLCLPGFPLSVLQLLDLLASSTQRRGERTYRRCLYRDHGNRGTKQNDKPGDVQLIKMPSSLSGHWRIHMEAQPWTENHRGSSFHRVCCGGWCSRVCTCIYVFSFWISRNSEEVGESRVNSKQTLPTLSVTFEESHRYQFIWYLL